MTSPNRLPLWEVMYEAFWQCPRENWRLSSAYMIRALRDWLVPEEPQEQPYVNTDLGWIVNTDNAYRWAERQRRPALLTAEADRAERGDCDKTSTSADR